MLYWHVLICPGRSRSSGASWLPAAIAAVVWHCCLTTCLPTHAGNYQRAFETYKEINRLFPDNVDCLRFLVRICSDLGLPEGQEYAALLKRAEAAGEAKTKACLVLIIPLTCLTVRSAPTAAARLARANVR